MKQLKHGILCSMDERCCGGVCLLTLLKNSEKLVEYLCLQCKYREEISHAVNVYRTVSGAIEMAQCYNWDEGCINHGTVSALGINPNTSKREDLDEECLQKVGWEWVSWEEGCWLAQGRNQ